MLHPPPTPVTGWLAPRLLAVIVLVAANAFFVAAEFALVAARRTRIEAMVRRGDRKAKTVQAAQQDLYRQLSAAQLGITVASILLGYVAEDTVALLFHDWFASLPPALAFLTRGGVATFAALALITFLHVVFGEQAPKAWAITYPEGTSRWIAAPLILFSWITRPVTELLNRSANAVVRLLGIKGASAELERIHSPEEMDARRAESPARDPRGVRRPDARGGVRVQREERARRDDAAHADRGAPDHPVPGAGGRPGGGGRPLALPGLPTVTRRHRGRSARQGDPRRAARRHGRHGGVGDAAGVLRAGHAGGRGRAGRHEAPEGAPRHRAGRVRRYGGPGHDGGPA